MGLLCTAIGVLVMLHSPAFGGSAPSLPKGLEPGSSPGTENREEPGKTGPALPAGLKKDSAPSLPAGMDKKEESTAPAQPGGLKKEDGPSLPAGLETPSETETGPEPAAEKESRQFWFTATGFWEARGGIRLQNDDYEKDVSIAETRFQTELEARYAGVTFHLRNDLYYDGVVTDHKPDLQEGKGFVDLRTANIAFSPLSFSDLKVGRQILTWGTGDMLFINDMFPKDWQSFFIGRDDEYLKAPSDAVKASVYTDFVNFDVVYTPLFDPDRYPRGVRLSYYNASLGRFAGEDAIARADTPDDWFGEDEWALRLYQNFRGWEFAAYGYDGRWKSPGGMDRRTGVPIFPELSVYGASLRGQIASGIANAEFGWYDSKDDTGGTDPFIDNGQIRFLLGYDRDLPEIARDLKLGLQYYLERMTDYDAYEENLPPGMPKADENRHVLTLRLTKMFWNQNLTLSLFTYYSPSDEDVYARPKISYKIDDHFTVTAGGNIFAGAEDHTFFGQFENNTNVYAGIRYGF
jgi:hypothetical protein